MTKINYSSHDDCGVFGMISKNANKISSEFIVKATECIRYRGSKYGAGYDFRRRCGNGLHPSSRRPKGCVPFFQIPFDTWARQPV